MLESNKRQNRLLLLHLLVAILQLLKWHKDFVFLEALVFLLHAPSIHILAIHRALIIIK